jgi:hypothetical protein
VGLEGIASNFNSMKNTYACVYFTKSYMVTGFGREVPKQGQLNSISVKRFFKRIQSRSGCEYEICLAFKHMAAFIRS